MNRLEIRTLARKRLGETTSSFWSDSELNNWINFGCSDVAQRTLCLRTRGAITTSAVIANTSATVLSEWTLSTNFPNFLSVTEIHFHQNGTSWRKLEHKFRSDLDVEYDGWRDAVGYTLSEPTTYNYGSISSMPQFYYWDYEEDVLGIYPPCDSDNATSNNLKIYYAYDHSNLAADTDSPTLPTPLHLGAVEWVVATGFETRGLGDKANDSWGKYFKIIKDYEINRDRNREDDDIQMKTHRRI